MCTIENSFVDPPETGFIDDSNITGSTIIGSNITSSNVSISNVTTSIVDSSEIISCDVVNSTIFNSTLLNCVLTNVTSINSTVDNATLIDVNITDANITDGILVNGTLVFNDTVSTGPRNLTDIMNFPPTASFTVDDASVLTGDTVNFFGTASDPNIPGDLNDNLTFNWTFGDGSINESNVNETSHNYTSAGLFTAVLTVTDIFGKIATDSQVITVGSLAPTTIAGGGGGGGGGGPGGPSISIGGGGIACLENWVCNTWNACTEEGIQTRECVDLEECGTVLLKPSEQRTCTFVPPAGPAHSRDRPRTSCHYSRDRAPPRALLRDQPGVVAELAAALRPSSRSARTRGRDSKDGPAGEDMSCCPVLLRPVHRPLDSPAVSTRLAGPSRTSLTTPASDPWVRIPPSPPVFARGGCTVAADGRSPSNSTTSFRARN